MRVAGERGGQPGRGQARVAVALCAAVLWVGAGACVGYGLYRPAQPGKPEEVAVTLRAGDLEVWPRLVRRGSIVFTISNADTLAHGLRIVGPGVDRRLSEEGDSWSPGEHERVAFALKGGTYRLFCPDGDHAARGLQAELRVQEEAGWFRR